MDPCAFGPVEYWFLEAIFCAGPKKTVKERRGIVFPVFEHFCIKVRIYRCFLAAMRILFMFIFWYHLRFACLCFVFEDQNDSADVCPTSNARFCRNTRIQCPARATTPCLVVKPPPPPPHPNTHSLIHTINRMKNLLPRFQHKQTHIHIFIDSLHLRDPPS